MVPAIALHERDTGLNYDFEEPKIIHKCNMRRKIILESFYTYSDDNTINRAFDVN